MKTIGLLGGMSWESTVSYYTAINHGIKERLGGLNSAKICMYSVNFAEIEELQHKGLWDKTAQILSDAAVSIEAGGADFLLICTNTMHKVAPQIESHISIPILHIADATAETLILHGIRKVGLLGTRFTMDQDFYKKRITDKYGISVVVPSSEDKNTIHNIIYEELCQGIITEQSRDAYLKVIDKLKHEGAEAVILGCTEIALLVQQKHTNVPLFDTTAIHANAAILRSLGEG
ncbi:MULTISPECIES: aspartate/glutamate racemase family protein [Salinivibrio]|jgi:aspartate racemase|uniref:Aspartate/glutamate racemase family protein n=1 Tax=Salinivibrio kushneri TaxID=1908198 RepID=A0AA47KJX0_9GAMM|nr:MULTISPECIES: aspartate/glutamate racemase family protein [Salinivibrio]KKA44350.1 hypothetical protein WN56_11675 [Salinivibrio sp. KP-1]OOE50286.1 aspartate/glutamate racemase [Salinivibrio kushneri]WBA08203.1 aspartate/glutamate racemase family protein [Salinivibrio kushneri]